MNGNGRTALITGGAKRIGRALSLMLAEHGFDIAVTYFSSEEDAAALKNEITALGRRCIVRELDLMHPERIPEFIRDIHRECPELELIINNASVFERCELRKSSLEDLDRNLTIHLRSPFLLSREFSLLSEHGHIINILDMRIAKEKTAYFAYLLSKKALADFTLMAAVNLGPDIRVNAVAPGLILPPEGEGPEYLEQFTGKIPAGRKGSVDDVLNAVEFLVQNDYITGQIIFADGGGHLS